MNRVRFAYSMNGLRIIRKAVLMMMASILFVPSLLAVRHIDNERAADSVLLSVRKMPMGEQRFQKLKEVYSSNRNSSFVLRFAEQMIRDGKEANEKEYEYCGWFEYALFYYNAQQTDSVYRYFSKLQALTENDTTATAKYYRFNSWHYYVSVCMSQDNMERGRIECQKMLDEATKCDYIEGQAMALTLMAGIYTNYHKEDEALEYYNKALNLNCMPPSSKAYVYAHMGELYLTVPDYVNGAIHYEKAIDTYMGMFPAGQLPWSYYDVITYNASFAALCYLETNQMDKCRDRLEQARRYYYKDMMIGSYLYYHLISGLYEAEMGDYDESMKHFDLAELRKELPVAEYFITQNKIEALVTLGHHEEAIPLMRKFLGMQNQRSKVINENNRKALWQNTLWTEAKARQSQISFSMSLVTIIIVVMAFVIIFASVLRLYVMKRELNRALVRLEAVETDAEKTDNMKDSFMRNISHDVRVPLNTIIGFSEQLIRATDLSADERQQIRVMLKESSDKLMNLVNNVLDLSRLESGKMKYQISTFDLVEISRMAVFQIKSNESDRCLVDFESNWDKPILIEQDSQRMLRTLASALSIPTYHHLPEGMDCWKEKMTLRVFDVEGDPELKKWEVRIDNSPLSSVCMDDEEQSMLRTICELYMKKIDGTFRIVGEQENGTPGFVVFSGCFKESSPVG